VANLGGWGRVGNSRRAPRAGVRSGGRRPPGSDPSHQPFRRANEPEAQASECLMCSPGRRVAAVGGRRSTPPGPRPPLWGLAGCCRLDPRHPSFVPRRVTTLNRAAKSAGRLPHVLVERFGPAVWKGRYPMGFRSWSPVVSRRKGRCPQPQRTTGVAGVGLALGVKVATAAKPSTARFR